MPGTRQDPGDQAELIQVFTGIVQQLGQVESTREENSGRRFTLRWPGLDPADPLAIGESVAVNGCCLTVVEAQGELFTVQAGPETLLRTNLLELQRGSPVNFERALKAGDRLGGHFVQGHVDATAALITRRAEGEWEFLAFRLDPQWTPLMVPKGSIAVDGVSLTLVEVGGDFFSVMLIPHTLAVTTLGQVDLGGKVNLEIDLLAKHLAKLFASTNAPAWPSRQDRMEHRPNRLDTAHEPI